MTDGLFTQKLTELVLNSDAFGIPIGAVMRNSGNQLSKQRMDIVANWYNSNNHEWLLSIDSDIIVELQTIKDLWQVADKNSNPIVSGIYYLFLADKEGKTPAASSSVFRTQNNFVSAESIDIEKEGETFFADAAGFGLLLIHRSVITKLIEKFGNKTNFFQEKTNLGEDMAFFKNAKDAKIPLTICKKATVQHMKRFSLGIEYFNLLKDK
jgi:GT2 family glycosyltransferase